jgi:hypothetical protein
MKKKWSYTHPSNLPKYLWNTPTWGIREIEWGMACTETFRNLPRLPEPVSASQVAKEWGVSHVTAKRRMMQFDSDFIQLTHRWFVPRKELEGLSETFVKELERHPGYLPRVINGLREFTDLPTKKNIESFVQRLKKAGIIKSVSCFSTRRVFYFVPSFIFWRREK